MIIIRPERLEDIDAIQAVVTRAFGQPDEAKIVAAIRESGDTTLSLIAEIDGKIIGHILFSPARVEGHDAKGAGLAPLSVHPDFQKTGVGAALTHAGLAVLRHQNFDFSIVLGHPTYYPRFGYKPAAAQGIDCPFGEARDAFMMLPFDTKKMAAVTGMARYHDAFH